MPADITAAEQFVFANARVLERHRMAVVLHGDPIAPVITALMPYRNPDGGFGHALEPDIRSPFSETVPTLHAVTVLRDLGQADDPLVTEAAAWVASVAAPDGRVPFMLPSGVDYPRAPWMAPDDRDSHLTFAFAAEALEVAAVAETRVAGSSEAAGVRGAGVEDAGVQGAGSMAAGSASLADVARWLDRAIAWCWTRLGNLNDLHAYDIKFGLAFLDAVPDAERAEAVIERLRPLLRTDGFLPVPGGTANERLSPLALSPRPGGRSRALFTDAQIAADLDRLEDDQQDDGGWTFDWAAWSPGQSVEWRGILTVEALATLAAHGRIG